MLELAPPGIASGGKFLKPPSGPPSLGNFPFSRRASGARNGIAYPSDGTARIYNNYIIIVEDKKRTQEAMPDIYLVAAPWVVGKTASLISFVVRFSFYVMVPRDDTFGARSSGDTHWWIHIDPVYRKQISKCALSHPNFPRYHG